jgi:hypothetical protein
LSVLAARAPSGEPVIIVKTVPEYRSGSVASFRPGASSVFMPLTSDISEGGTFQNDGALVFPGRRPQSVKLFLFRLTMAVIALAVVAGVTASQWKPNSPGPSTTFLPKRIHHVPQIRNIDPYMPAVPNATPQRRYPSPLPRSHEGYY